MFAAVFVSFGHFKPHNQLFIVSRDFWQPVHVDILPAVLNADDSDNNDTDNNNSSSSCVGGSCGSGSDDDDGHDDDNDGEKREKKKQQHILIHCNNNSNRTVGSRKYAIHNKDKNTK